VFFGEVTVEKNKTLPDASGRERFILATMSVVILWMGIGSAFLTRRTESATKTIRNQMERQQWPEEATVPVHGAGTQGDGDGNTITFERFGNR